MCVCVWLYVAPIESANQVGYTPVLKRPKKLLFLRVAALPNTTTNCPESKGL